jgi:hypothetical protein
MFFFISSEYNSPRNYKNMTMTMSAINTTQDFGGISRMSDEDYESEFNTGTPRPGTSRTFIMSESCDVASEAETTKKAMIRSFSQAAKEYAARNKKLIRTNSHYRMGVNTHVKRAFNELEERLNKQRTSPRQATSAAVMSQSDFQLLKQGIENFHVKIVVHDSLTLAELKDVRDKCYTEKESMANIISQRQHDLRTIVAESVDASAASTAIAAVGCLSANFILQLRNAYDDLDYWWKEVGTEIRRVEYSKEVPSQQAEISRSSGLTLQNILTPSTIRRRFISLNALTKTIRNELKNFITDESRHKDRATVVEEIKQCCRSSRKQKCGE